MNTLQKILNKGSGYFVLMTPDNKYWTGNGSYYGSANNPYKYISELNDEVAVYDSAHGARIAHTLFSNRNPFFTKTLVKELTIYQALSYGYSSNRVFNYNWLELKKILNNEKVNHSR